MVADPPTQITQGVLFRFTGGSAGWVLGWQARHAPNSAVVLARAAMMPSRHGTPIPSRFAGAGAIPRLTSLPLVVDVATPVPARSGTPSAISSDARRRCGRGL